MESEELLDRLLPSLTEFCEYTSQFIKKVDHEHAADETKSNNRLQIENLFAIKQIIKMFEYLDYSDIHGKKILSNLCLEIFSNSRYVFLYDEVMAVYKLITPNLQSRINNICELISDIKDPHLKIASSENESSSNADSAETNEMTINNEGI